MPATVFSAPSKNKRKKAASGRMPLFYDRSIAAGIGIGRPFAPAGKKRGQKAQCRQPHQYEDCPGQKPCSAAQKPAHKICAAQAVNAPVQAAYDKSKRQILRKSSIITVPFCYRISPVWPTMPRIYLKKGKNNGFSGRRRAAYLQTKPKFGKIGLIKQICATGT